MMTWTTQHRVEVFLPLRAGDGRRIGARDFDELKSSLAERFGGVTAYTQSPAEGLWAEDADKDVDQDDLVILEVMVDDLDYGFWRKLQADLERRLQQEEVLIRAHQVLRLRP